MSDNVLLEKIRGWIVKYYGIGIEDLSIQQNNIMELPDKYPFLFRAIKINEKVGFAANRGVIKNLQPVISKLSKEEVFSTLDSAPGTPLLLDPDCTLDSRLGRKKCSHYS